MISEEIRQAILVLETQGRGLREISRALKVSRNTVRRVLRGHRSPEANVEDPRVQAVTGLLPQLYRDCKGNAVRIGEILEAQHGLAIPYSTLTRLIHQHTDLRAPKKRTDLHLYATREEVKADVIDSIEMFYNSQRQHSYLGYTNPMEFEAKANAA